MDIVYVYQKTRSQFGKHPDFRDSKPALVQEIQPEPKLGTNFVERNPTTVEIQCAADSSEHEVNTQRHETQPRGMLHVEGGWPRDVDPSEPDHTIRYRKKIEKEEAYQRQLKELGERVEYLIKQNNAVDIYQDYFSGRVVDHSSEPPSAKTLTVFRDPNPQKRTATSISWSLDGGRKLVIAYSVMQFQKMPDGMSLSSYIWDIENPNFPEQELTPPSPLVCLEYNPKDPNVLVGGTYNGLLALFDARTKTSTAPSEISPIERSHRDPVYDVFWIASKSGTEFFSVSTDGQVLWWDYRRMGEPMEKMLLEMKGEPGGVLGGVSLDYDPSTPTKFLVGTEQGIVLMCNKKAKRVEDRISTAYTGHHGPIYALQHNPSHPKYFLTVGDWTARIWNDEQRTPIMTTKYHMSYLTDGCWSPTRPGVFFTTKMDGSLDIWDYFFKQNDPTFGMQVSESGLHCLNIESGGRLIATGAMDGSTTLLEVCDSLYIPQSTEKTSISQMFERETKREKNLEARAKELRMKAKKGTVKEDKRDEISEAVLRQVEEEFNQMLRESEQDLGFGEAFDHADAARE
eukprot:TRINITY_DN2042_c0_g1_i2.p1 TRINITY_DN2042_c0_g1~~TRINITY_DN2042_c0_g1_i2.p1  ORF type:complete len:570 (+),score=116.88 TRINITY_DN2042_c0_g1_i2:49-1758(+)